PADEVSLKRVINVPKRGIGDQTVAAVERFARAESISISEAVDRADEIGLGARARSAVGDFGSIMRGARDIADGGADPADVLARALESSGYVADLEAERTIEALR